MLMFQYYISALRQMVKSALYDPHCAVHSTVPLRNSALQETFLAHGAILPIFQLFLTQVIAK